MDADRYRQLDELFAAALECAPDEREEFVAETCAQHPELRAELQQLLAADAAAGRFLEGGAFGAGVHELTEDGVVDAAALSPDGAVVSPPLDDGAIVDHFRVLRRIGSGATGAVYVARDLQLGRRVALKVIDPTLVGSTAARQRFLREARTTARFNHPNIVTIHAVGESAGRLYLALEYLEGRTLAERLADNSLSRDEMIRIATEIADALAEAHRHGVLHRDLKPSNVVITREGAARVLDFGIATCLAADDGWRQSPTDRDLGGSGGDERRGDGVSRWFGTPAAMAPEQWAHGPITPAADVWALGMILLEHLVGERPWHGLTAAEIGERVLRDEALGLLATATIEPPEPALRQLLERCLDPDPLARPTAVAVGDALGDIVIDRHTRLASERAPFRGLLPWEEHDQHWFCGRTAEVDRLVGRLGTEPAVVLAGPSGAGKSSLIQAGIIPRLRRCGRWEVVVMRPGTDPLRTLLDRIPLPDEAAAGVVAGEDAPLKPVERLLRHPGLLAVGLACRAERTGARVLLVIDQLEELFTLSSDEAVRRGFLAAVLAAADDPAAPVRALLCARQDYLGELARIAPVAAVTGRITVVGVPGPAALRETLTTPVAAAGYAWDPPTLVDEMVAAVTDNPAALSLLQFVGLAMWRDRDPASRTLPALSYHRLGGAVGALARHADGVLDGLGPSHAAVAREILLRLVTPQRTRRVGIRDELLTGLAPGAPAVLEELVRARIVVIRSTGDKASGAAELELAHEALTRMWPRLERWLGEGRGDAAFLTEVGEAARLWERRGMRPEELWRSDALDEAERRLRRIRTTVPGVVTRFVAAGVRRQRQRQRRRRMALAAVTVSLAALAFAFALVGVRSRRLEVAAESGRVEALVESAAAMTGDDRVLPARAMLRTAFEISDSQLGRVLWHELEMNPSRWRGLVGGSVTRLAAAPDGSAVAALWGRSVTVFDVRSGAGRVLRSESENLVSVAFSASGRRLVATTARGGVTQWQLADGSRRTVVPETPASHGGCVVAADVVACAAATGGVRLIDLASGDVMAHLDPAGAAVQQLAASSDGRRLAALDGDGRIRLWELPEAGPPVELEGRARRPVVLAADGGLVASVDGRGRLLVWDPSSGRLVTAWQAPDGALIRHLALAPDRRLVAATVASGRVWLVPVAGAGEAHAIGVEGTPDATALILPGGGRVVTAGRDGVVRLWDSADGRLRGVLQGHRDSVTEVAAPPDGSWLATAGIESEVRLWRPQLATRAVLPRSHQRAVYGIAFSADGEWLASGGRDGRILLWSVASGRVEHVLEGHDGPVMGVAFAGPTGPLASVGADGSVLLWSRERLDERPRLLASHRWPVHDVRFSRDGRRLATSSWDGSLRVLEVTDSITLQVLPRPTGMVGSCAIRSDGRRVVGVDVDDSRIVEWDVASGRRTHESPQLDAPPFAVDYSGDERGVVASTMDGRVVEWRIGGQMVRTLARVPGRAYWLRAAPAGDAVAVPVSDGTVRLVGGAGRELVFRGHRGEVNRVAFGPDGVMVASVGDDGTVRLWRTDTGRAAWYCPLVMADPGVLYSHNGWCDADGRAVARPPLPAGARQAVEHGVGEGVWLARVDAGGTTLCLATAREVRLWDLAEDRELARSTFGPIRQLEARRGGCVAVTEADALALLEAGGYLRAIGEGVDAAAVSDDEILAVGSNLGVVAWTGEETRTLRSEPVEGATAVLHVAAGVLVGFRDGTVELVVAGDDPARRGCRLEPLVPAAVERLAAAPADTVAVGFANGEVGIWSLASGARLMAARLHGPVVHLATADSIVYAATELGDATVFDLTTLQLDRCEVLRRMWADVPVVWASGSAELRPPPAEHECEMSLASGGHAGGG